MIRLALALLVLFVSVAHAEDAAMRSAKRHFDKGEKLFALGKFDDALDEYQKAFDAKPIPDFLFNIGQCYRNLGDYDQAIFSYKKYLKLEPDAVNRDAVEKLISDLEDKRAAGEGKRLRLDRKRDHDRDEDHPPPPPPDEPFYKQWWFWTGVGVVTVGGSIGIYEATRGGGPPNTDLGNIVFGR